MLTVISCLLSRLTRLSAILSQHGLSLSVQTSAGTFVSTPESNPSLSKVFTCVRPPSHRTRNTSQLEWFSSCKGYILCAVWMGPQGNRGYNLSRRHTKDKLIPAFSVLSSCVLHLFESSRSFCIVETEKHCGVLIVRDLQFGQFEEHGRLLYTAAAEWFCGKKQYDAVIEKCQICFPKITP